MPGTATGADGPTVRPARFGDLEALRHLYLELADGPDARPAGAGRAEAILTEIAAQAGRLLLVAEVEGGRIAGTLDMLVVPNLTHDGRPWAVVENVVVALADRRRGVGRALMRAALEWARRAGCYRIQLSSSKHRTEAHAFYRSLGFEAVAEGFRVYFDR